MKPSRALLAALTASLLLASPPLAVQGAPFGAYNPAWDGLAYLFPVERPDGLFPAVTFRGEPAVFLHGSVRDLDPQNHALLIVGPQTAYAAAEVRAIRAFLEGGGRVVLADDIGAGRVLLEDLGLGLRISGHPVFTPAYWKEVGFPIAFPTGAIVGFPDEVVLNHPTVIVGDAAPVLVSHAATWVDANDNGLPDLDEPRGYHAFAALASVGAGSLLVVGDPSIFLEDMQALNGGAAQVILEWLTAGGRTIILDEGHRASGDPLGIAPIFAGEGSSWTALGVILAGSALVVAIAVRVRLARVAPPRRHRHVPEAHASTLMELDP